MLKRNTNLVVKLLLVVSFIGLVITIFVLASSLPADSDDFVQASSRKILIDSPKLYSDLDYAIYYDPEPTEELLTKVRATIKKLEKIDKSNYTCEAAIDMHYELDRLKEVESKLTSDLDNYLSWEEEHYYAAKVFEYFMQRGFSKEVTCAIIGNMMIETSGGTLNLKPNIYSPSGNYYGLCQWSQKYYPETKDLPFEYQLDYLLGSMTWEFNTFGKNYKSGFKYEDFFNMTDVEEAALAFAKSYERCGPVSYEMRQEAALKAYEYFS